MDYDKLSLGKKITVERDKQKQEIMVLWNSNKNLKIF
jgi:hypothetical protein